MLSTWKQLFLTCAKSPHSKVLSDNHSNMQRIPDDSSIFTAEAQAVVLALDFISVCDANNKFIIFSDSLSVFKAMNHTSSKNPQIQKLLEQEMSQSRDECPQRNWSSIRHI